MSLRNTTHRWGAVAQLFHWLIVVLLIAQFALAWIADDQPAGLKKLVLLARHKSIGITVLALVVLRLLWRWSNATPLLPRTMQAWERYASVVTHGLLYLLLFALPLTGWMMSSARGFPVSWFNLFQLPDLVGKSKPLFDTLVDVHGALATTLLVVAGLHLLAALKHHFWLKDDVLRRMLPGSSAGPGE